MLDEREAVTAAAVAVQAIVIAIGMSTTWAYEDFGVQIRDSRHYRCVSLTHAWPTAIRPATEDVTTGCSVLHHSIAWREIDRPHALTV